ncbi:flotillin family protein [Texcoconibacillus texcoconensis]|uniref:flotillin family protein n=1 Tax=Texcoconibacillus texcoconensis TaxID=1095777 RepID=UPI003CCD03A2
MYTILFFLLAGVGYGIYYIWLRFRYRTAKSNEALVITGRNLGDPEKEPNLFTDEEGRSMKIVRGGGYRLRRFQTSTPIDLTSFQLHLTTPRVITNGGVPIIADAVSMVKVADALEGVAKYAEQFLGKKQSDIEKEISEVLSGILRAILSKMTVEEINNDREAFNEEVTKTAQTHLQEMGFKITSLGLTDLRDAEEENGYLENLGRPRIAKVRKEAEIAEANSERETRINKAKTDQEAKEEEYKRQIAIAESRKEKDLKDAAFKEETERARAKSEQSYELEKAKLAKQVKDEELAVEQLERERAVELENEEYKVRQAKADADYYEKTKQAEAEAEVRRQDGSAEAQVIRERGEAEADARRMLAEAMDEHGEAIIKEKLIEILPDLAEQIAKPMNNIESVKIIDSGSGESINSFGKNVTKMLTEIQEPVKELTGVEIGDLMETYASRGRNYVEQQQPTSSPQESETETHDQEEERRP